MTKYLCFKCVEEAFLREKIRQSGIDHECSYCKITERSISFRTLADEIEEAFDRHYSISALEPEGYDYIKLKEFNIPFEPLGDSVVDTIAKAAKIPVSIAKQIQELLEADYYYDSLANNEMTSFGSETFYHIKEAEDQYYQKEWTNFENILKKETRFFNTKGLELLSSIFSGLSQLTTRNDKSIIMEAGAGTSLSYLYRARVFQSPEKLKEALADPDQQLGPPPSDQAVAGRMNARGISVFYGSNDPEVAIAEVRPPVGSEVVIGKFRLLKPIKLLDLTALADAMPKGSIFDKPYLDKLEKVKFLQNLSGRMSAPVMPDDEASEYLITQSIADFLASSVELDLDGIAYPSAQYGSSKSFNVIMFHKSSKVESLELNRNFRREVETYSLEEDGSVRDYTVFERRIGMNNNFNRTGNFSYERFSDVRKNVLSLSVEDIHVHIVGSVQYTSKQYSISWIIDESTDSLEDVADLPF